MDKIQNSLIANLEIDKLDILSGGFKPPIKEPLINGALWNDVGMLKISGMVIEPGIRIRYTSTDDLTTMDAFAIGGTAHISDNGDGTYDLWSNDNCEFIALSDYYYDAYSMNITKIEVIEGSTLKYFHYYDGDTIDTGTFSDIPNVTEIILSTSLKPDNTDYMFSYCGGLTSLDITNLDTSNVTSMDSMFGDCTILVNLNISNFDTSNVTNMQYMFSYCEGLTSLDITNFNTSSVTIMDSMFGDCTILVNLDVTNFDTSNVIDMRSMFDSCTALTAIDVSNFDTSNVTTMEKMFDSCTNLASLDVTNFDTSNVTTTNKMFYNTGLTNLDVSNFTFSSITNINEIFAENNYLKSINLSGWALPSIETRALFEDCIALECITNLDTTNSTTKVDMFKGCTSLIQPDATTQTDLTDSDGANWINPGSCP